MNYDNITEEEMREMINRKIEKHYPKLVADSKRISGYNFDRYGEDLLAYTIEKFLCDKPLEYQFRVAVIDDKLPNYFGRAMSLYIKSGSSPFWHRYRKDAYNSRGVYEAEYEGTNGKPLSYEPTFIDDEFDTPEYFKDTNECIVWASSQIHWYYQKLIEEYYFNNLKYIDIHRKYGISLNSVRHDIKHATKLIKQICQNSLS